MKTLIILALLLLFAAAAGVLHGRTIRKRLAPYYSRRCCGRVWRTRFPGAKKEEIRAFLRVFADAFLLDKRKMLSFSPDDKLLEIYRTLYPEPNMADTMEAETLVMECKARYGVDLTPICGTDPTLGDIFRAIHKPA